jgi:hypothetical protein
MRLSVKSFAKKIKNSKSRFSHVFKNPLFWILSIVGNMIILVGGAALMLFEMPMKTGSNHYIDYILWSAGLVTTIGYGDFMAQTLAGKWTVLIIMLLGTLFIWSYMAFLVAGFFSPELKAFEKDIHEFEKDVRKLKIAKNEEVKGSS